MDHFAILGLSRTVTPAQAKSAWREKMRLYHPDRLGNAPPEVMRAAEETAKVLNHAYECVLRDLHSPMKQARPSSTRPQGQIPTAHDLLNRARASLGHANEMVDRWRRSSRGCRKARQSLLESAALITDQMKALDVMKTRLQARWHSLNELALHELNIRLFAPIESHIQDTLAALDRSEALHTRQGMEAKARATEEFHRARRAFEQAEAGPFSQPVALVTAMSDVQERLHRAVNGFEHLLGDMVSMRTECVSASERLRPQYRSLLKRHKEMIQDDQAISDAVERAQIAASTLLAIAQSEAAGARGSEALWRVGRMSEEAKTLHATAAQLVDEWKSRTEATEMMNRWIGEFKERISGDRTRIIALSGILIELERDCGDLDGAALAACHEGVRQLESRWMDSRVGIEQRFERLESKP